MDLSGWVGFELGGNFDFRCGIVMRLRWAEGGGVVFAGLVGLTSASRVLLRVGLRRLGAFVLWKMFSSICEMLV
jgi:hypothetical protein